MWWGWWRWWWWSWWCTVSSTTFHGEFGFDIPKLLITQLHETSVSILSIHPQAFTCSESRNISEVIQQKNSKTLILTPNLEESCSRRTPADFWSTTDRISSPWRWMHICAYGLWVKLADSVTANNGLSQTNNLLDSYWLICSVISSYIHRYIIIYIHLIKELTVKHPI